MYGSQINTLKIEVWGTDSVWSKSGDQGQAWKNAKVAARKLKAQSKVSVKAPKKIVKKFKVKAKRTKAKKVVKVPRPH